LLSSNSCLTESLQARAHGSDKFRPAVSADGRAPRIIRLEGRRTAYLANEAEPGRSLCVPRQL
ncbi:MAG TPA: hypothetical protein VN620_17510, partial [Candidatus Methylomirabilis sp.]|nr:hypothetical protein [Candidatus Methylomirabilis sp.]